MLDHIKDAAKQFTAKFSKAWTACAITMVEGDLTVFTINHAITAAKTGTLAGGVATAIFLAFRTDSKMFNAWALGIITAFCDLLVHPTHFGHHHFTEAAVTGIGAGVLAYLFYTLLETKSEKK